MTTRPCSLAIAALVVALAAAAARPAAAGLPQYTEMFATLTMVDGTMKQRPGASCPFTAAKDGSPAEAACGKAFTVHWSNETTNDDGLWEVELLQGGSPSGSSLSALYCAEGVGTASGDGKLWLAIGFGDSAAKNVRLTLDDATGGVLLAGYEVAPGGAMTQTCSAMYSLTEDNGLAELLYDDLTGAAQA